VYVYRLGRPWRGAVGVTWASFTYIYLGRTIMFLSRKRELEKEARAPSVHYVDQITARDDWFCALRRTSCSLLLTSSPAV
jgi:hypothetical protein